MRAPQRRCMFSAVPIGRVLHRRFALTPDLLYHDCVHGLATTMEVFISLLPGRKRSVLRLRMRRALGSRWPHYGRARIEMQVYYASFLRKQRRTAPYRVIWTATEKPNSRGWS